MNGLKVPESPLRDVVCKLAPRSTHPSFDFHKSEYDQDVSPHVRKAGAQRQRPTFNRPPEPTAQTAIEVSRWSQAKKPVVGHLSSS